MNNKVFFESGNVSYLITDGTFTKNNFAEKKSQMLGLIRRAIERKISLIQIREKLLPARLTFELAIDAVRLTKYSETTKLLINDRADIALAADADGVHLTAHSVSTDQIRRHFPKKFIIGVSTHSMEKARLARRGGADFVTFSPIFATPSKNNVAGLKKLSEVCRDLQPFPVIALGGINRNNYKSVLEAGAAGFAAIRFLNEVLNQREGTFI